MSSVHAPVRGIGLALALASPALVVAGCGGAKSPSVARIETGPSAPAGVTSTASTTASPRSGVQRLIAYSACMRRSGVPNFPDPNSNGNLVITPADNLNPAAPAYTRAQHACGKLSPQGAAGHGMTPAQHARALAAMTRYVACMRAHAVPMADPFSGPNGGVGITLPRSVNPSSGLYKRADLACQHLQPNGG